MILFRGLEGGAETQLRLSEIFGAMQDHPLTKSMGIKVGDMRLSDIRYDPGASDLYELSDGRTRGAWLPWHYDLVYVDKINRGGILRPLVLPKEGGDTGFIDQIAAYATLPRALAEAIDKLNVVYRFDVDSSHARFGDRPARRVRRHHHSKLVMESFAGNPRVIHPMVYEQAETGRKVLNISPWFAQGIEGAETAEGDALLAEVIAYATDARLAYVHRWEPEDMVLWDNWRMMHCAFGVPENEARHMQRTTIAGDYGRGRIEGDGVVAEETRIDI
jgi:taurine dioxygenase